MVKYPYSLIMEWIEKWLKEKKKAGFLVDAIDIESPASGFYARRGWQAVPGNKDQFVYNLPKDLNPDVFVGVEVRSVPVDER